MAKALFGLQPLGAVCLAEGNGRGDCPAALLGGEHGGEVDDTCAFGSLHGGGFAFGIMHMEIGREGFAGCRQRDCVGIGGIGADFRLGMDEGEEERELPVAGIDHGDCLARR